jgi:hypothetical protein
VVSPQALLLVSPEQREFLAAQQDVTQAWPLVWLVRQDGIPDAEQAEIPALLQTLPEQRVLLQVVTELRAEPLVWLRALLQFLPKEWVSPPVLPQTELPAVQQSQDVRRAQGLLVLYLLPRSRGVALPRAEANRD